MLLIFVRQNIQNKQQTDISYPTLRQYGEHSIKLVGLYIYIVSNY